MINLNNYQFFQKMRAQCLSNAQFEYLNRQIKFENPFVTISSIAEVFGKERLSTIHYLFLISNNILGQGLESRSIL